LGGEKGHQPGLHCGGKGGIVSPLGKEKNEPTRGVDRKPSKAGESTEGGEARTILHYKDVSEKVSKARGEKKSLLVMGIGQFSPPGGESP